MSPQMKQFLGLLIALVIMGFLTTQTGGNKGSSTSSMPTNRSLSGTNGNNTEGDWKESLALALRTAGVEVSKTGDGPITSGDRQYNPIVLYGKVNPEADRRKIEGTVKTFIASHPGMGRHDIVVYFDAEHESGTLVKKYGMFVKICDL